MKWIAVVIGALLCLMPMAMPMAFAQQPEMVADVITGSLPGILGGGILGSLGGGILGSLGGGILGSLGGGILGSLGGGVYATLMDLLTTTFALVVDIADTVCAVLTALIFAGLFDLIDTGFVVLIAWITDIAELFVVVPMGIIGALIGTPLVWCLSCLCLPCSWVVDIFDTCFALVCAWCPGAIVDLLGAIWSIITPLYAVCLSCMGTLCGGCWSIITPLYALGVNCFATYGALLINWIVDTVDALLNGLVDVLQSCSYWIGDIYLYIAATFWDVILFVVGDILINGIADIFQSCSYWLGDIYLYIAATFWDVILFVVGDILINGMVDGIEAIAILTAGFNDIDLGSYLFQTVKTCAFMICEPVFYILNCMGLCHVIPFVSWFMACCHGIAQLILLWINFCINVIQHTCMPL